MEFVLQLVEIGVKIALAPVIVPLEIGQAIGQAIDDLNGPPEDNWDPGARVRGYEETGADSNDG